mmetsp:Transcript_36869/g.41083  ORF Transcript_36869/g.41083 Transcript_36869/m.41083 type:complete len:96 (-) Transcript_36869:177-464(-)
MSTAAPATPRKKENPALPKQKEIHGKKRQEKRADTMSQSLPVVCRRLSGNYCTILDSSLIFCCHHLSSYCTVLYCTVTERGFLIFRWPTEVFLHS